MQHRPFIFVLLAISAIEAGLGLQSSWPSGSLYRNIEAILFSFLPMVLWLALAYSLRANRSAYKASLWLWLVILFLCAPLLIALRSNDLKGLLWLGLHFWWAVVGLVGLLAARALTRKPDRPNP